VSRTHAALQRRGDSVYVQDLGSSGGTFVNGNPVEGTKLQQGGPSANNPARDIDAEAMAGMADRLNRMMAETVTFRDRSAVARFFDGLEFVEPGLVQASKWRPASESEAASPAALWGGVARKP